MKKKILYETLESLFHPIINLFKSDNSSYTETIDTPEIIVLSEKGKDVKPMTQTFHSLYETTNKLVKTNDSIIIQPKTNPNNLDNPIDNIYSTHEPNKEIITINGIVVKISDTNLKVCQNNLLSSKPITTNIVGNKLYICNLHISENRILLENGSSIPNSHNYHINNWKKWIITDIFNLNSINISGNNNVVVFDKNIIMDSSIIDMNMSGKNEIICDFSNYDILDKLSIQCVNSSLSIKNCKVNDCIIELQGNNFVNGIIVKKKLRYLLIGDCRIDIIKSDHTEISAEIYGNPIINIEYLLNIE